MYQYTLCLIQHENHFLLLNRQKQPAMGMWNGVGGKIEEHETPKQGALRETYEETGIKLEDANYIGDVLLHTENATTGIYLFLAKFPSHEQISTPLQTREGILDWKEKSWVLDEENLGVIGNLKAFLPKILNEECILEHVFHYEGHTLIHYETRPLEQYI